MNFDEINVNHGQDVITCTQIYKLMDTCSILLRETQLNFTAMLIVAEMAEFKLEKQSHYKDRDYVDNIKTKNNDIV